MEEVLDKEFESWAVQHKVIFAPKPFEVEWANNNPWFGLSTHPHWSRQFEYPWVLAKGDFQPGMKVLDAAGGKGELSTQIGDLGCDVLNVDLDAEALAQINHPKVTTSCSDIIQAKLASNQFDRIVCCSVLEHCKEPLAILNELWRLLAKGGKILVTMDVASNRRANHTIDEEMATSIVHFINPTTFELPECPTNLLVQVFPEIEPKSWEHPSVLLRVLCFSKIKT